MNGGLKIKLKIIGAADANVKFVPPSKILNPEQPFFSSGTPFRSLLSGVANRYKRERFDWPQNPRGAPYSEIATHKSSLADNKNVTIHEVVIPNYNQNRFVASVDAYYSSPFIEPANDMGDLFISVNPNEIEGKFQPYKIEIALGFTDETRLGFQVFAPEKELPLIEGKRDSIYSGSDGYGPNWSSTHAPAAYYFKN